MEADIFPDGDGHGLMWLINDDIEGDFGLVPFERELIQKHLELLIEVAHSQLDKPAAYLRNSGVELMENGTGLTRSLTITGPDNAVLTLLDFLGAQDLNRNKEQ